MRYPTASSKSTTSIMPLTELTSYRTLIRLGRLDSGDDFVLAIRAVRKAQRYTNSEFHLFIVSDEQGSKCITQLPPVVSRHTPTMMGVALSHYSQADQLLEPSLNTDLGQAFLHALASGVPLDGMNYQPAAAREPGMSPLAGEAFLGAR